MKIALLGYGRMGKEVEQVALERGHSAPLVIDQSSGPLQAADLAQTDVAIDFTLPGIAPVHIRAAFDHRVPIVVGTTGWYDTLPELQEAAAQKRGTLFYAPNFSIGVNMLFEVNKALARLMNEQADYDPEIFEVHHTGKQDAPSGTAAKLADQLTALLYRKINWQTFPRNESPEPEDQDAFPVYYSREEGAIGTHTVRYQSAIDEISIQHKAYNRRGFALGAVKAAEWVKDKAGIYTMEDYLGLNNPS